MYKQKQQFPSSSQRCSLIILFDGLVFIQYNLVNLDQLEQRPIQVNKNPGYEEDSVKLEKSGFTCVK